MSPTALDTGPIAQETRAGAPPGSAATTTILVVDDDPDARRVLTELLQARGFRIIAVAEGEEVFRHLGEVQLVLLDAMLPGRDGWSICTEIKEHYDPLLPVVMVTARTAPEDVVRTFSAGADDYIPKPYHAAELSARIESRLRVHRAELELKQLNRQLAELAEQNYRLYEQARRDAQERMHLLRELDHRVRNNLSVILGLVGMERNRRPFRAADEALISLENRLRSFLLVHEALRRENYRGVPMRDMIERLAQRVRNTLDLYGRVHLEISGDAGVLNERQSFALALAVNELITNALRHGFTDDRAGTIAIRIEETAGRIALEIADDGVGMKPLPDAETLGSGRSVVSALVKGDLGGKIEYLPAEKGTRVRVTFPREG